MTKNVLPFIAQILEQAPMSVAVVDRQVNYLYANRRWIEIFNLPADFEGKSHYEFVPHLPKKWRKVHEDCLAGKAYIGQSVEVLPTSKDPLYLRRRIEPWHDAEGEIGGMIFFVEVMNEAIAAETLRKAQAAQYQTLLENMSAGVVLHAQDGRIIASNPQASQILGLTHNQLLGISSIDPSWHTIHEDGSPFDGQTHPSMQALASGKKVHDVIMGVYTPDKQLRWISINADPIFMDDEKVPQGVVVSFHDISALKLALEQAQQSEMFFRTLFQDAPVAILMVKPDGQIIRSNQIASKMFGYSSDDFQQLNIHSLIPKNHHAAHQEHIRDFVENPHSRHMASGMVFEAVHQTGSVFPVEIALTYMKAETEITLVAFVMDSSIRLKAEEARQTANLLIGQLETEKEISRFKSNFLSIVSHDFRTPLSVIMTSTSLLRMKADELTPEQLHHRLDRIDIQVKRLLGILEEVSQINKMQHSQYQLHKKPLNLLAFLRYLAEEALLAHPNQQIGFHFSAEGNIENVLLDESLLDHIFSNLLSNALKYSPQGGQVSVHCQAEATHISIQIKDQGMGIPEEDQAMLFKPFHRASNVGGIEGSGLGLVIAKQGVEAHRGEIWVESQVGMGTTFTVTLPL